MRCPFCAHLEDKVIDSRLSREGDLIRRRRECFACHRRFTSYERVEEPTLPVVVKKGGNREPFDRQKILSGLKKACEKRPVSVETLEMVVGRIARKVQEMGLNEVDSTVIGEEVMRHLNEVDPVAYVRFASVYREFKDIDQFMSELKSLLDVQKR
jgi:transcriptional repressor NrdR